MIRLHPPTLSRSGAVGSASGGADLFPPLDRGCARGEIYGVDRSDRVSNILAPLEKLAKRAPALSAATLGDAALQRSGRAISRYIFLGPHGGGDPIHIAVFAGIHGDEPAGSHAVVSMLHRLVARPEVGRGYRLFFYPICNPTGLAAGTRASAGGKDLNREFWKGSPQAEVRLLEHEIRQHRFQGLISLHSDDTSDGMYGFVRGAVLTRALLEPALGSVEPVLARNRSPIIDGFAAEAGIISECYEGILTSPPELEPIPFEIILESPQKAALEKQEQALVLAMETILLEYQKLMAFAANL